MLFSLTLAIKLGGLFLESECISTGKPFLPREHKQSTRGRVSSRRGPRSPTPCPAGFLEPRMQPPLQGAPDFAPVPRIPEPVPPRTPLREVGPSTTLGGELLQSPSTMVTRAGDTKQRPQAAPAGDAPAQEAATRKGRPPNIKELRWTGAGRQQHSKRVMEGRGLLRHSLLRAGAQTVPGALGHAERLRPPAPHPERLSPSPHSRPLRAAVASVPPGHHARATHQAIRRTPRGDSSSSLGSQIRSYLHLPHRTLSQKAPRSTRLHQATGSRSPCRTELHEVKTRPSVKTFLVIQQITKLCCGGIKKAAEEGQRGLWG